MYFGKWEMKSSTSKFFLIFLKKESWNHMKSSPVPWKSNGCSWSVCNTGQKETGLKSKISWKCLFVLFFVTLDFTSQLVKSKSTSLFFTRFSQVPATKTNKNPFCFFVYSAETNPVLFFQIKMSKWIDFCYWIVELLKKCI